MTRIIIAGGGLAGLSTALLLNRYGFDVTVVEKKVYPFNKVCGEYISNEVLPYLRSLDISVDELNPARITKLVLSSASGSMVSTGLDLGGFGLTRFRFDALLYEQAVSRGVRFITGSKVNEIRLEGNKFKIALSDNSLIEADLAIAAHGKRSNLDQGRTFFSERSPYLGVKYHIKTNFPPDVIQLDNFDGGYCGICRVEDEKYSLCYLVRNEHLKAYGNLHGMEEQILFRNPNIKRYFREGDFLNEKPQVINEISFSQKSLAEKHVLYCGDSAGMITPLCGNGMAMAIHSGKILAQCIYEHLQIDGDLKNRRMLEHNYKKRWSGAFAFRLSAGRLIQNVFMQRGASALGIGLFRTFPSIFRMVIEKTHGQPF